jgi:hypothetical protein
MITTSPTQSKDQDQQISLSNKMSTLAPLKELGNETDPRSSSASTLASHLAAPQAKELEEESSDEKRAASTKEEEDVAGSNDPDDIEYPTGIKMFFIVVALVLSIFLLSLDMVCFAPIPIELQ